MIANQLPAPRTLLFLCTGNYYRSRYAEALFNALAAQRGVAWRAESRGFMLHPANIGPISPHTLAALQSKGICLPQPLRGPAIVEENDLAGAVRVVAVKEAEHRPLMQRHFPAWAERIDYWHIHDVDVADPSLALVELETNICQLLDELHAQPPGATQRR